VEFTRAATARLKNCLKWTSSGCQLPVIQWQRADPACSIFLSGRRLATNDHSFDFAFTAHQFHPWPIYHKRATFWKLMRSMLWLIAAPVPLEKILRATSAHSGTMALDWRKLTSIWVVQTPTLLAAQTALPLFMSLAAHVPLLHHSHDEPLLVVITLYD